MELCCEFWCGNFGGRLSGIVFAAISLPLNEVLESSPVPTTVEYLLYITNGHLLFVMGALILQGVQKCKVR